MLRFLLECLGFEPESRHGLERSKHFEVKCYIPIRVQRKRGLRSTRVFELADSLSDAIVAATRLAEEFRGASDVMCITERDRWVVARVISRSS
jgi:hypothetical protein